MKSSLWFKIHLVLLVGLLLCSCAQRATPQGAEKLLRRFDHGAAERIARKLVLADSTNADALALLLRIYYLTNDSIALDSLQTRLRISRNPHSQVALGQYFFYFLKFDSAANYFLMVASHPQYKEKLDRWIAASQQGARSMQFAQRATLLQTQGAYDSSIVYNTIADSIAKETQLSTLRVLILGNRASVFELLAKIKEADQDTEESLRLAQQSGDWFVLARAYFACGVMENRKRNTSVSIRHYTNALECMQKTQASRSVQLKLYCELNLAIIKMDVGEIEEAKKAFLDICSVVERIDEQTRAKYDLDNARTIALFQLGSVSIIARQYSDAERFIDDALTLAEKRGDFRLMTAIAVQVSALHDRRGDYESAEKFLLDAKKKYFARKEFYTGVFVGTRLARLYLNIGRYDDGLAEAQHLKRIVTQQMDDPSLLLQIELIIAEVYESKRDFDRAIRQYEASLSVARQLGLFEDTAIALDGLMESYARSDRIPSSTQELETLISDAEGKGFADVAVMARQTIARIAEKKKDYQHAAMLFNQVIASGDSLRDPQFGWYGYNGLGNVYSAQGKNEEALGAYSKAIGFGEQLGRRMSAGKNRAAYFDKIRETTEAQIVLALDLRQYDEVFALAEKAKARAFLSFLANREFEHIDHPDSSFLAQERQIRANLADAHSQIVENPLPAENQTRSSVLKRWSENVKGFETQYAQYLHEAELKSPVSSSLVTAITARLEDIRAMIPQHTLILQYVVLDSQIVLCALKNTKNQFRVYSIPFLRENLQSFTKTFVIGMRDDRAGQRVWETWAKNLAAVLLDSVATSGLLADVKTLVVLPDDCLHYLPFQALPFNGRLLVDRFAIVNYPSASVMYFLQKTEKPEQKRQRILAVAYSDGSIPNALKEADLIKKLFSGTAVSLVGQSAVKDSLIKHMREFDILHFAVHGVPSSVDPSLFALQLAPGKSDDGRLFIHDVFGLDLTSRNPTVILSACETGVGQEYQSGISPGGEVASLHRAFLFAGARTVVSTLWKVDDRGSLVFMDLFYRALQREQNSVVALQQAQQAMRVQSEFRHPFYWAAYIVTGMR